jgi:cob(I)alamin adenosyltransferase
MKIYTKTGDKGNTSLFGGTRIPKFHIRIEAYGTVDELNAQLGKLVSMMNDKASIDCCRKIQSRLFDIGSSLAVSPEKSKQFDPLDGKHIRLMEQEIDRMNEDLPDLRNFILPGSSVINAQAHIARTICRRAERRVVELSVQEEIDKQIIVFLNRFSDYLFVLGRWISFLGNEEEIKWIPDHKKAEKNHE